MRFVYGLLSFLALVQMLPRLLWSTVIEGQIGKQSFVAHMIQSYFLGYTDQGFPLRFFFEPWHAGVIPWAEEFPLYHLLSTGLAHVTGLEVIVAARSISFLFFLLFLGFIFQIARKTFPERQEAPWLAIFIASWMPGVQTYGTSVMPDMAMLSMIAGGFWLRLSDRRNQAYGTLAIAALFKYYALFAILGLMFFDGSQFRSFKQRLEILFKGFIAGLPTVLFLGYFVVRQIPNPVIEYRSNGYGHLSGPFLFQIHFYLRFLLWVFVKNPTLVFSLAAFAGCFRYLRKKSSTELMKSGRLALSFFAAYTLFAMSFASSFFVHDYYALPFVLPVLIFGMKGILETNRWMAGMILIVFLGSGAAESRSKVLRMDHYLHAAQTLAHDLAFLPDFSKNEFCIFITDFSKPPLANISRKSGWTFDVNRFNDEAEYFYKHLEDPRAKSVVVYLQGSSLSGWSQWSSALAHWKKVTDSAIDGRSLMVFVRN